MMAFLIMQLALPTWAVAADRYPNLQVVIDAGHGGSNIGAVWQSGNTRLVEKDLTCKLTHLVKEKLAANAIKISSSTDKTCNYYTSNGGWVTGSVWGFEKLLDHIRTVSRPSHMQTLVVSLHVDKGWTTKASGAYVIVPEGRTDSRLASNLVEEFAKVNLDQVICGTEGSIIEVGDCDTTEAYILLHPPVDEIMILEVANIRNADDRYRLTSELGLELYSDMIVRAILKTLDEYAGY
jgi:N-acetylmuramoyl-L-alanine amidase